VVAGLQLTEAGLGAGVAIALEREAVAAVARALLGALGPAGRCAACRRELVGIHLLRTRGLDERHGVVCPRCGAVWRSYWRYGEVEGLEALAPVALQVGLVAEVTVALGDATLGFQLLPDGHAALTAAGLVELFHGLYLEPYGVEVPAGAVRLRAGRRVLAAKARLAGERRLALSLDEAAGLAEDGLVELLRARIERRFRPDEPA
jgi:hypothetical protein